jgi:cell wall-associated NlpC family hydrolase
MSFSDAIGHIDQIVQWEQQLANPAALTQTTSSGGTATADQTSSTGANSSSFANELAQAQAQGGSGVASLLDPTGTSGITSAATGITGGGTGITSGGTGITSPSDLLSSGDSQLLAALQSSGTSGTTATGAAGAADPRVAAMVQEADSLVGKPYVWGGGHNNFGPQTGYDCSGFVSAVLHAGGYLSSPADTQTLPSQAGIAQGPGQYVTIYDRTDAGSSDHVIIQINGQFYESGGEQGSWGGGGGVAKIATPSASYLATFNQILHPAGL